MTVNSNVNGASAKPAVKVERNWEYFPRHSNEETALFKYEIKPSAMTEKTIFCEIVPLRGCKGKDTEFELFYRLSTIDSESRQKSDKVLQIGEAIKFVVGEGKESKKLYIPVNRYNPYNLQFEIKPTKESRVPIIENKTYLKANQVLDFSFRKGKGGSAKGV